MTKEQIEEAIEYFSNNQIVTIDFTKLPKEFRKTVVQYFKELKAKSEGSRRNPVETEERNPDTCYGSAYGNVCECCDDKCANNPNQN